MTADTATLIPGSARFRVPSDLPGTIDPEFAEHAARWAEALVRRVRSHGLRVTPGTVPTLARSAHRVAESLGLARMPEVYVVSDPGVNAKAIWAADAERSFIEVHSGLLRICRGSELDFVLGHELAHIAFGHSARQDPPADSSVAGRIALMRQRRMERAAEISCDRIGFLATRSVATASRVIMKVASGLDDALLGADAGTLLQQLESEQGDGWSMHATHPALPLRLWALWEFSRVAELGGAMPLAHVNDRIEARLDQEAGDELRNAEDQSKSKCLFWLGIALVHSSPDADAIRAMQERFGVDEVERGLRFASGFPHETLRNKVLDHVSSVVGLIATNAAWVLMEFSRLRSTTKSMPRESALLNEAIRVLMKSAGGYSPGQLR